jgi:HK97 family phage prohead protease
MKTNNIEKRSNPIDQIDGNRVAGYAIVFNSRSVDMGGFYEQIERGAVDEGIINASDVFAVLNHDRNRGILARSRGGKGSLQLTVDERGLRYEFELGETPIAQELKSYLERGEIDSSSFAFTIADEEWIKEGDSYLRTIKRFDKLFDISPVFQPAYLDATVARRAVDEMRAKESEAQRKIEELKAAEEKRLKMERLNKVYAEYRKRLGIPAR